MTRFAQGFSVLLSLAAVAACDKKAEPPPSPKSEAPVVSAPVAPMGTAPAVASSPTVAPAPASAHKELTWQAPASFQTAPNPSTMRKATYKIAKAKGDTEDAELSVIGAGGGLEPNIQRWAGQFEGKPTPKRSTKKVGDLDVTLVELDGTFSGGGMPGMAPAAPKAKWKMLAAIVELGDEATFFKLTGPEATVGATRKDFEALVASLRVK